MGWGLQAKGMKHFFFHDYRVAWRVMRRDFREVEGRMLYTHEDTVVHDFVCNERVAERLAYRLNTA